MDIKKDTKELIFQAVEGRENFSIQAFVGDMLHAPEFCFNREQFLRTEFQRFYSQDIINKIIISNPACAGVPPEVIEKIPFSYRLLYSLPLSCSSSSNRFSLYNIPLHKWFYKFKYAFGYISEPIDDFYSFIYIYNYIPRWNKTCALNFCCELLCAIQILFYIYGLQQINIGNGKTSFDSEIVDFFILSLGVMLGAKGARENFSLIVNILRENGARQEIIIEAMRDEICRDLMRGMSKRVEEILKKSDFNPDDSYITYCKDISDCLKLELYYPQYIQTLRNGEGRWNIPSLE